MIVQFSAAVENRAAREEKRKAIADWLHAARDKHTASDFAHSPETERQIARFLAGLR